jgi:hypothetical protein
MQSKQGRSGAASSSSKPKAPPGQKVSGRHVFQGEKLSKPPSVTTKTTDKRSSGAPPKDDFGGSREGYIAGSGSTIGTDAPSDFTEKEKKSFGLAQDEKVIKAYSEGRIDKVPDDYVFQDDTKNKEIADEKFTEFLEDTPEKSKSIPIPAYAVLLKKWLVDPTPDMFTDPNKLAILRYGILKNPEDYVDYFKKWKDVIGEGMGSIYPTYGEGAVSEDFERFKNAIESASIPQGSEAQRQITPWDYYDKDLYYDKDTGFHDEYGKKMSEYDLAMQDYPEFLSNMGLRPISSRFGNTMGNLADIAKINLNNPDMPDWFKKDIVEARAALDRQGRDIFGNKRTGTQEGGEGILSLAAAPTPFTDVNNNGILDNLEVAQATTTPTTTATTPTTTATTPTTATVMPAATTFAASPFDYSQWPQYMQQGIASPNLNPWYNTLQNYYGVV